MTSKKREEESSAQVVLPGTVQKVIPGIAQIVPPKAEIAVEGADHLYREIRIDNVLEDKDGKKVSLKEGAQVDVKIEADSSAVEPAQSTSKQSRNSA